MSPCCRNSFTPFHTRSHTLRCERRWDRPSVNERVAGADGGGGGGIGAALGGGGSGSDGMSGRLVATLLTLMDGVSANSGGSRADKVARRAKGGASDRVQQAKVWSEQ
eukprot:220792-Chlamydomonas_euryale.AAC.1